MAESLSVESPEPLPGADLEELPPPPVRTLKFRTTFAALRHRNYRLFFAGQLVSLTGTWMQATAQGWLIYEMTHSKKLLGEIAAVGSLPMLVFTMVGGAVADRVDKRKLLVVTQVAAMLLALALGTLVVTQQVRVPHVFAIAALAGLVMSFDMPCRQAFVVEMVGRKDLMNAIALNSSIMNAARIVGPSIAGLVMAAWGLGWCFLLNGVSFLAVIAGLLLMQMPPTASAPRTESAWWHTLGGFRYVRRDRRVLCLLALLMVGGVFGWSYAVLMPAFARDVLHIKERAYGFLLASNGVGAIIGALSVASLGDYPRKRRLVFGGMWLFSAGLAAFAACRAYWLALPCLAVAGCGMVTSFSTSNTVIQTSVPDEVRGRVMGVWALVFAGMVPVGSFQAGTVAHHFSAPIAVWFGSSVCALFALVMWLATRHHELASASGHGGTF